MTNPIDSDNDMSPGSPRWYLSRLTQRLLGRHQRYLRLERYALGDHPYPNGDRRYVAALRDLQSKAKTNYIELVIKAVVDRMRVREFRFGKEVDQVADEDAQKIWNFNDMDYQSPILINNAATFGDTYALVSPADEDGGEPIITIEDPKLCIIEKDPIRITRSLAGLKMWQDDVLGVVFAALYLPDATFLYQGPAVTDVVGTDAASLLTRLSSHPDSGGWILVGSEPNPYGRITLIKGDWMPSFGTMSRGEAENVFSIQDRINHTILDRLVIAKSQAYNQRWVTGLHQPGSKNATQNTPPFKPGSDMVWATYEEGARFGQFDPADLTQILEAIRDDVGDLAAISQTPATYLMNRMVNVSGDTLTQDQSALITKIKLRQDAMGWMFEQVMKTAFLIKGDTGKATESAVSTVWADPEIRTLAEQADALTKWTASGLPIELVMQKMNFTAEEIQFAVKKAEEKAQQDQAILEQNMKLEASLAPKPVAGGGAKAKPTSKPSGKSGSTK